MNGIKVVNHEQIQRNLLKKINQKEIAKVIEDVKLSDVDEVTGKTKEGVKSLRIGEKMQEEKE